MKDRNIRAVWLGVRFFVVLDISEGAKRTYIMQEEFEQKVKDA